MKEKTIRHFENFKKAVSNLEYAILNAKDDLSIDGAIKRFELTYEISWKLIKSYLEELGIFCRSPRECFKYAYQNDLIDNDYVWEEMIDDRNILVHTYTSESSREVFEHIKEKYLASFKHLLDVIKKEE